MIKRLFQSKSIYTPSPAVMVLSYLVLGVWAAVILFPLYWVVVTSLKLPVQINSGPFYLPGIDFEPSLHAWAYILSGQLKGQLQAFFNTVVVSFTSSVLALILGAAAAYALVRFQYQPRVGAIFTGLGCLALIIIAIGFGAPWQMAVVAGVAIFFILLQTIGKRFKRALRNNDIAFWLISQRMLPPVVSIVPIYIMFQQVKLLDTRTGLIIVYITANLPFVIWILRDYFRTIPLELEESAALDGASRFRIFWSIVLPLSVSGLVGAFILVLVGTWNEYLVAVYLTNQNAQTFPLAVVGLAVSPTTFGPQWWYISVLVLIMITPVIVVAIALERFITRGLLSGAMKG
jgi:multiple sugar transport system permease protein